MVDESASAVDARMDGDPDGTITVSGGSGPNFDDFDSVEDAREEYAEAQSEKNRGSESIPEENRVGEAQEESDPQAEADKNIEHSAEKDPDKIEIKFLKAKLGEEELEISPDTEIPVNVDGETKFYRLQDLMNHEAGQVAWDKRFGELSAEKRAWRDEIEDIQNYKQEKDELFQDIGKMHEFIQQGKPYDAMEFLVAQTGGNPYAFKRVLMEQLAPEFERLSMMTPEEQQAEFFRHENEFLREQMRSSEERVARESSEREALNQLASEREARGISQEAYDQSAYDLIELGVEGVTPQLVMDHAEMRPLVERSENIVARVSEKLVANDEVVVELAKLLREDKTLTDEEAVSLVRDSLGIQEKERVVLEKARSTGQIRRQPENPGNYKYYGSSDPGDHDHIESFGDYDELY